MMLQAPGEYIMYLTPPDSCIHATVGCDDLGARGTQAATIYVLFSKPKPSRLRLVVPVASCLRRGHPLVVLEKEHLGASGFCKIAGMPSLVALASAVSRPCISGPESLTVLFASPLSAPPASPLSAPPASPLSAPPASPVVGGTSERASEDCDGRD